jgi:type I restriction enzyme, S subunit
VRHEHLPLMMNTSVIRFHSRDRAVLDDDYLFAYLRSPLFQNQAQSFATGAAQLNFGPAHLKRMEIPVPPIHSQRKVAAIITAYDDLIENDNRRITLMEEMGRRIYREWFDEFRYPGHDAVPLVDSELGSIPLGWDLCAIGDVVSITGGGTPSKEVIDYWKGGQIQWFTPTDLTASGYMFISESKTKITRLGLAQSSARLFPPRSVMLTSRATIGVLAIATVQAATNQGFITCIRNERLSEYHLYFWLDAIRDTIVQLASGATFKEINKATFRRIKIPVPPLQVEEGFRRAVEPIGDHILALQHSLGLLRTTRDLLLPGLVSGEIDVDNLDIQIPDAA